MITTSVPDIAIIGGGIMSLSTAYFLKTLSPSLDVTVVEADPSYEFCSTLRASGGAYRFPPFESAKCHRTWAGLYEQCELDGNPIIGATSIENFYAIAGFSGHGMMHAPAAGRGIAEPIVHGEFKSIDLTRMGYARVTRGEPYREAGFFSRRCVSSPA
jgi:glycine/D-amino acid oxidase-like deaminating enzyme